MSIVPVRRNRKRLTLRQAVSFGLLAMVFVRCMEVRSDSVGPQALQEGPVKILEVVSPDLLRIEQPGSSLGTADFVGDVRLIGISVPTRSTARTQALRAAAKNTLVSLLQNGTARLQLDRRQVDREHGTMFAYVFVGDEMLNELLIRSGYGRADICRNDSSIMTRRLTQAEAFARQQQVGIWELSSNGVAATDPSY